MSSENTDEQKINPLINKLNRMPGTTFRLPSKGLLYHNGELDESVKDGELLVYPMTTLDEIYMRSPDMLFQGTAIEKVFSRRIPQIKKPLELFSNDVDYLLVCLRKVSYGDFISIKHRCDKCPTDTVETRPYDIPLNHFFQNTKELSADVKKSLSFTLSNGFKINLKAARVDEVLDLYRFNNMNDGTSLDDMEKFLIKSFSTTIDSVDGVEEKEFIEEWLSELPRTIMEEFKGKLEKINNWGVEFNYTIECEDCGAPQQINTVLNPLYFFILPSEQTTEKK